MASVTLILTRTPLHEFVYTSRGNVEADSMTEEQRARFYRSRTQPLDRPPNVIHYSGRWGSLLLLRGPQVYGVASIADDSQAPATVGPQYVTLPTKSCNSRRMGMRLVSQRNIHRWNDIRQIMAS